MLISETLCHCQFIQRLSGGGDGDGEEAELLLLPGEELFLDRGIVQNAAVVDYTAASYGERARRLGNNNSGILLLFVDALTCL